MGITEPATISSLNTKRDLFSLMVVNLQMGSVNYLESRPLKIYCLQRTASLVTTKDGNGQGRRVKGLFRRKTTVFDVGGGKTVQEQAERKCDEKLLTRIRVKCLFSVEAGGNTIHLVGGNT